MKILRAFEDYLEAMLMTPPFQTAESLKDWIGLLADKSVTRGKQHG